MSFALHSSPSCSDVTDARNRVGGEGGGGAASDGGPDQEKFPKLLKNSFTRAACPPRSSGGGVGGVVSVSIIHTIVPARREGDCEQDVTRDAPSVRNSLPPSAAVSSSSRPVWELPNAGESAPFFPTNCFSINLQRGRPAPTQQDGP